MTSGCEWCHALEAHARRILGILKKSVKLSSASGEDGWFSLAHMWGGADGKASIERLCLSSYVEKNFNSKVIKSFVPELRNRKCFSCFEIPMFYVYMLWTFYVRFTHIHIMGMVHFVHRQQYKIKEVSHQISLSCIFLGAFRQGLSAFLFLIFVCTTSLCKLFYFNV